MTFQLAIGAVAGAVITVFVVMAGLAFIGPNEYGVPLALYAFLKDIVGPVAAGFGGAISGAFVSYRFQQDNEAKLALREEAQKYNRAMGLLAYKLNDIASIKISAITPYEGDRLRFITIPAMTQNHCREERATDTLSDILIGRGLEGLLPIVFEAEERYHAARESFYERARLIANMREKTELAKEGRSRMISLDIFANIHGAGATIRMYRLTEQIITAIDQCIEELISALEVVSKTCGAQFKQEGMTVIAYAMHEDNIYRPSKPPYFKDAGHLEECLKSGTDLKDSIYSHSSQRSGYSYRSKE